MPLSSRPLPLALAVALLIAGAVFLIRALASRAPQPSSLGLQGGRLAPCPGTPNCASSAGGLDPIRYSGERADARARLLDVLAALPRCDLRTVRDDYIHALCRSRVFGFIDDLEFHLPGDVPEIRFRSAARTGYYDFGANHARLRAISRSFASLP